MVRGLILGLLLAATLGVGATALEARLADYSDEWRDACHWTELATGVSCEGMEPPRILLLPDRLMDAQIGKNVRGFFYPQGRIVYVRESMSDELIQEIVVHETVHYILDQYDPWRIKWDRCASEEAARLITDLYKGRAYSSNWKNWYNCPKGDTPF